MAFPKKGMRKITIDNVVYAYNITGNDDYISFSIGIHDSNSQILTGSFSYHVNKITHFNKNRTTSHWSCHQRIKITPNTIMQVIQFGLKNGWNPLIGKGELNLNNLKINFEEKIQLNLKEITQFPELNDRQVALYFSNLNDRKILNLSKKLYNGEGEIYQVFDNLKEALNHAKEEILKNTELECWIMNEKDKAVFYYSKIEEKNFLN